jgi:hypothetical protein
MPEPTIDYSCPHCGEATTYRLVPEVVPHPAAAGPPSEIPSIDLRCLRCETGQIYKLVPDSVRVAS